MKQEDKDLLLKDLCGRLPYGVKCKDDYAQIEGKLCQIGINYDMCVLSDEYDKAEWAYIPNCKPYLFPLSSMTEEQKKEEYEICKYYLNGYESKLINFYHKNHLDYRGLISMGLAIDATNLNIY